MSRFLNAVRIFFRALTDANTARQTAEWLSRPAILEPPTRTPVASPETVAPSRPAPPALPSRSEAVTLLATLQRESRLVDFLLEDLSGYEDAQIGAAVRDIQRDAAKVVQRVFALQPIVEQAEGTVVTVAAGFEPSMYHLVGNVTGQPPFAGRLSHHGWLASRVQLPAWTGSLAGSLVVAPAEVELP